MGTGGSTAGRGGTTGTGGAAGRGGSTGTGGTTGTGGGTGANCVENIILMGYSYPPAMPCSACIDNNMSREAQCKQMLDCLEAGYPCTGNCY